MNKEEFDLLHSLNKIRTLTNRNLNEKEGKFGFPYVQSMYKFYFKPNDKDNFRFDYSFFHSIFKTLGVLGFFIDKKKKIYGVVRKIIVKISEEREEVYYLLDSYSFGTIIKTKVLTEKDFLSQFVKVHFWYENAGRT